MKDQFNLKKFLVENKLTPNSRLLAEGDEDSLRKKVKELAVKAISVMTKEKGGDPRGPEYSEVADEINQEISDRVANTTGVYEPLDGATPEELQDIKSYLERVIIEKDLDFMDTGFEDSYEDEDLDYYGIEAGEEEYNEGKADGATKKFGRKDTRSARNKHMKDDKKTANKKSRQLGKIMADEPVKEEDKPGVKKTGARKDLLKVGNRIFVSTSAFQNAISDKVLPPKAQKAYPKVTIKGTSYVEVPPQVIQRMVTKGSYFLDVNLRDFLGYKV